MNSTHGSQAKHCGPNVSLLQRIVELRSQLRASGRKIDFDQIEVRDDVDEFHSIVSPHYTPHLPAYIALRLNLFLFSLLLVARVCLCILLLSCRRRLSAVECKRGSASYPSKMTVRTPCKHGHSSTTNHPQPSDVSTVYDNKYWPDSPILKKKKNSSLRRSLRRSMGGGRR